MTHPLSTRPLLDLDSMRLTVGAHAEATGEMCVMEAAAYLAGEDWTDRPASVSPLIIALLTGFNDAMNDVDRQSLKPLIPMLPGTAGDEDLEARRSWLVMDWHCRVWPSVWLRSAGCVTEAEELEGVAAIVDAETLSVALRPLHRARVAASAKREATIIGYIEDGLASAIAAAEADENAPALVAARARIRSGDVGAAVGAERLAFPTAEGWDAKRRACWTDAWDAAIYRMAAVHQTAQIAAVRALSASSAWDAGWNVSCVGADETWLLARGDAKVASRDAARAMALAAAWTATRQAHYPEVWRAAADAATAAIETTTRALQRAAIELVGALVDLDLDRLRPVHSHVNG